MISLFIDTCSVSANVALVDGNKLLSHREKTIPNGHSKYTTSLIKSCLDEVGIDANDVDNIMVCNGPGSFTGVRIGVAIAKTYGYLIKKDITPISSLKELAISCPVSSKYLMCLRNASKNSYYVGMYDSNYNLVKDETILDREEIIKLYKIYNPKVISDTYDVIGTIKVDKVNLDFTKLVNYYLNKDKVPCHSLVPNYIKLPQVLESK